ncbi:MAG TPA: response regulator [Blastocatellia bacterium]|nr:response regulator [Blastocatellia bacterium]
MKSIFIAEGTRSVARLFAAVFAHHNWKVTSVSDGIGADEALRGSEHYDVVLVSYEVPGMNGVELIKLVRALEHRKHTPVVMVTGTTGIEVEAFRAGASAVLYKPIDIYSLVAAVSKYISETGHQERPPDA